MKRARHPNALLLAILAMVVLGSKAVRAQKGAKMGTLNMADLRDLARGVGFPEATIDIAVAVAMAESSGNPLATAIVTPLQATTWNQANPGKPPHGPERSFGLWQINTLAHPTYDEGKLLTADYNARAAFAISSGGLNWHPWATYTNQAYLRFMPGGTDYA